MCPAPPGCLCCRASAHRLSWLLCPAGLQNPLVRCVMDRNWQTMHDGQAWQCMHQHSGTLNGVDLSERPCRVLVIAATWNHKPSCLSCYNLSLVIIAVVRFGSNGCRVLSTVLACDCTLTQMGKQRHRRLGFSEISQLACMHMMLAMKGVYASS